jgi:hypothetical protein
MLDAFFLNTDHDNEHFYDASLDSVLLSRKLVREQRQNQRVNMNSRNTTNTLVGSINSLRRDVISFTNRTDSAKQLPSNFQSIVHRG